MFSIPWKFDLAQGDLIFIFDIICKDFYGKHGTYQKLNTEYYLISVVLFDITSTLDLTNICKMKPANY